MITASAMYLSIPRGLRVAPSHPSLFGDGTKPAGSECLASTSVATDRDSKRSESSAIQDLSVLHAAGTRTPICVSVSGLSVCVVPVAGCLPSRSLPPG